MDRFDSLDRPLGEVADFEKQYLFEVFYRCVEDSNDTVMLTDRRGRLFYVNGAWSRLYGYSFEEAVGATPALLQSGKHGKSFYEGMWKQILSQGKWSGELVNRTKAGNEIPVFLTISSFNDGQKTPQGFMGIAVDIAEKKRLEDQLHHQDKLASLGMIAAGLAHEIGNPLGVIRGRAEYLSMTQQENPELGRNLDIIVRQIDRISTLVQSLLHLARSSRHDDQGATRVDTVLAEVVTLLAPRAGKAGVRLVNRVSDQAVVAISPSRLEQVLLNLLLNAVQSFEASSDASAERLVEVSSEKIKKFWNIQVRDTGLGIATDALKRVFDPFFTTKPAGEGTGLGLSICQEIVKSAGGRILVDSQISKGSRFKVQLPSVEPHSEQLTNHIPAPCDTAFAD